MKPRTQDDYIRTALRVPPELHARIHESAKEAGRTFNAEILARLEASFRRSVDDEQVAKVVSKLSDRIYNLGEDADVAKAATIASSAMTAKVIEQLFGEKAPPAVQALRSASLRLAEVYRGSAEKSENKSLREALALLNEITLTPQHPTPPQDPKEGGNGLRDEPQAPAKLDRWAKPKVRPEQPQYPKPKKHK